MKRIKIALCDDSENDIQLILSALNRSTINFEYDIDVYNNAVNLLNRFQTLAYDIVMLDIDMPTMSGFELAYNLKEMYNNVLIIFITSKAQLVFESFKYRPISFLNKNNLFELESVFNDVYLELKLLHPYFSFTKNNVLFTLYLNEIIYFKKNLNDLEIHTIKQVHSIRSSLKAVEREINNKDYVHLSKSIFLNSKYVTNIDFTNYIITLTNGEKLKFSRLYKKIIKKKLC